MIIDLRDFKELEVPEHGSVDMQLTVMYSGQVLGDCVHLAVKDAKAKIIAKCVYVYDGSFFNLINKEEI